MFNPSKKKWANLLTAATLAFGSQVSASDAPPDVTASVQALGELNGRAIACQYLALSARLREIIIAHAPKERNFGELYEQATSQSYLRQGQSQSLCPDGKQLADEINLAAARLKAARGEPQ